MNVLVFGENGQVARSLRDEADAATLTVLGSATCNLRERGAGARAIAHSSADIVINAAGYTAVDGAEKYRDAARQLNSDAPAELAAAARTSGARFIHLSTDYVFDGDPDRPGGAYAENASPSPLSVYGTTKREGEIAVLSAAPDAIIIRTSWVFSPYGSNFVKTMLRAGGAHDRLKIVDDQIGGPTPARAIARAILSISAKIHRGAPGGGIYHFQGTPIVSWADFATEIFSVAGMNVAVEKIPTSAYPTPARRPLQTALECGRIERDFGISAPDWRIGLRQAVDALRGTSFSP